MKHTLIASCLALVACSGASGAVFDAAQPIDSGADVSTAVSDSGAVDDRVLGLDAAVEAAADVAVVDGGTGAIGDPCDPGENGGVGDCKQVAGMIVGCETFHLTTAGGDPWHRCSFDCGLVLPSTTHDVCEQTLGLHCDAPQGPQGGGTQGYCLP